MQTSVWSLEAACNGLLAGLVSITACAPVVSDWSALIIGAIGGLIYLGASSFVVSVLRVDDVVDAFAVHGACGLWSLLACGLFADGADLMSGATVRGALHGGGGTLLAAELLAACSIIAWSVLLATLTFGILRHRGWMRISDDFEMVGIDIGELGRPAYHGGHFSAALQRVRSTADPMPTVARAISQAESSTLSPAAVVEATRVDTLVGISLNEPTTGGQLQLDEGQELVEGLAVSEADTAPGTHPQAPPFVVR